MKRYVAAMLAVLLLLATVVTVWAQDEQTLAHELHSFRVASEAEARYLVKEAALNNANIRFADAKAEMIYRFPIKNGLGVQRITLTGPIYQQVLLFVSTDGKNYTEAYRWTGEVASNGQGGLDLAVRSFDLTPYVDTQENIRVLYIKLADSYTSGGWGSAIHPSPDVTLDIAYTPLPPEQLDAYEMRVTEHSVPLFGCNESWGGGYMLDTEDAYAGSAALAVQLQAGDTVADVVLDTPRNGSGMDTLELELYLSDLAISTLPLSGSLEISSSGRHAQAALAFSIKDMIASIEAPKVGWNRVVLPLNTATATRGDAGDFDLGAVNFVRLGWSDLSAVPSGYVLKIDSIRLTDRMAAARAEQMVNIFPLLDDLDVADAAIAQGLNEQTFRSIARLVVGVRKSYAALTGDERRLADEEQLAARLAVAEAGIAAHEQALASAPLPRPDAPSSPTDGAGEALTPPPATQETTESIEPTEQPPSENDAPTPSAPQGMHPMIAVAVVASLLVALNAAIMACRGKKNEEEKEKS